MDCMENWLRRQFLYTWYLIKHKWYVFYYGRKLGVPLIRLIRHDLSKLLPDEWYPYSYYYYGNHKTKEAYQEAERVFRAAWLVHYSRNDHHFEWWHGAKMSEVATREMVADWVGAGLAKNQRDVIGWYGRWKHRDKVHPETIARVEELLAIVDSWKLCKNPYSGYWEEVQRILQTKYKMKAKEALSAINSYKVVMALNGVGDVIYHASCEENADGIITGEYR